MTVAEKVKSLRGDMSMDVFSKHIKMSKSLVSMVENGKRAPGLEMVKNLSKFSGKPMEYWVD